MPPEPLRTPFLMYLVKNMTTLFYIPVYIFDISIPDPDHNSTLGIFSRSESLLYIEIESPPNLYRRSGYEDYMLPSRRPEVSFWDTIG